MKADSLHFPKITSSDWLLPLLHFLHPCQLAVICFARLFTNALTNLTPDSNAGGGDLFIDCSAMHWASSMLAGYKENITEKKTNFYAFKPLNLWQITGQLWLDWCHLISQNVWPTWITTSWSLYYMIQASDTRQTLTSCKAAVCKPLSMSTFPHLWVTTSLHFNAGLNYSWHSPSMRIHIHQGLKPGKGSVQRAAGY